QGNLEARRLSASHRHEDLVLRWPLIGLYLEGHEGGSGREDPGRRRGMWVIERDAGSAPVERQRSALRGGAIQTHGRPGRTRALDGRVGTRVRSRGGKSTATVANVVLDQAHVGRIDHARSEEHTSELQS